MKSTGANDSIQKVTADKTGLVPLRGEGGEIRRLYTIVVVIVTASASSEPGGTFEGTLSRTQRDMKSKLRPSI